MERDELALRRAERERVEPPAAEDELLALARDRVRAQLAAGEPDPLPVEHDLLARAEQERTEAAVRLEQLARELRAREESLLPREAIAAKEAAELDDERRSLAAEAAAVAQRRAGLEERERSLEQEAKRQAEGSERRAAELAAREGRLAELAAASAAERRLLAEAVEERAEAGARLEAVARELREREAQLARRELASAEREARLTEGELEQERRRTELAAQRGALLGEQQTLERRREQLDRREQTIQTAEELVSRARADLDSLRGQLEQRQADLARGERQLGEREERLRAHRAPAYGNLEADLTERAAASARVTPGRWNLYVLDRTVRERSGEFPARAEEWSAYLSALREVADSSGALPRSLHTLLNEVFAPLAHSTA